MSCASVVMPLEFERQLEPVVDFIPRPPPRLIVLKDPVTGWTRIRKRKKIFMVRGNGMPWCRRCPYDGCDGGDNCLLDASNAPMH